MKRLPALLIALTLIYLGVSLIITGTLKLSWQDLAIMTGSWLAPAGFAILVRLAARSGNGKNGKV